MVTSFPLQAELKTVQPTLDVDFAVFEYPPLYHTAKTGDFSGKLGETFKALCREGGLNCKFTMYPVPRAYEYIKKSKAHILITGKHPQFEDCCMASNWTYTWTSGLFSKKPLTQIPDDEQGLMGDYLAVVRGWIAPFKVFPHLAELEKTKKVHVAHSNSNLSAIKMLDSDRASYLYGAEEFYWFFEKAGLKGKFNFRPLRSMPLVLWVPKKHKNVLERLNQAFGSLQAKGMLNEKLILKKELMEKVYQDAEFRDK